jgi:cytochrome o ubiquinol oxidase operon protein cyoD
VASTHITSPEAPDRSAHATLKSYVIGFLFSVMLTLVAYFFVVNHTSTYMPPSSQNFIIAIILALALAQFAIQLVFFLHLGKESKPRWKLTVFLFMIGIVSIVVFGSLWIMSSLNYRMTPQQIDTYMNNQDGL